MYIIINLFPVKVYVHTGYKADIGTIIKFFQNIVLAYFEKILKHSDVNYYIYMYIYYLKYLAVCIFNQK